MKRSAIKRRSTTKRSERSEYKSDALWRGAVLLAHDFRCVACGQTNVRLIECDHIIPRSQGGLSDTDNGLPICGPLGCGFHPAKTAGEVKIDPAWLLPSQLAYLARKGWVTFDPETGEPSGRGMNHFSNVDTERANGVL